MITPRRSLSRGAAVVDFVLVLVVLIPLVLGILQVALTLYVRNTLAAAASEGARYAATQGSNPGAGVSRAREQIGDAIAGRFADDVTVHRVLIDGVPAIEVRVRAHVPALGLGGPSVHVDVAGHAIEEPGR